MFSNLSDYSPLQGFNLSAVNVSFAFGNELDIFFQPENVLITLYVPVILLSFVANILLIVVAVKCNYTKNVTNMFLVNLSAADLLVTGVCMPIQLSKAITLVWFYGETICKIVNYIQGVAVAASVFTITAMSVDRWLSISTEPRLRPPGRKQALLLLLVLWCAALLIFIPLLLVASVRKETIPVISKGIRNISIETRDVHFCTEEWPGPETKKQFGMLSFTLVYAIPGSITIMSYACMGRTLCSVKPPFDIDEGNVSMQQGLRLMKERKRVAWILLLLAVLFALCWLPYNIMQLLLDVSIVNAKDLSAILPYALFIGHANSAINPIVYCLMTRNFQRSARKLLCSARPVCKQTFTNDDLGGVVDECSVEKRKVADSFLRSWDNSQDRNKYLKNMQTESMHHESEAPWYNYHGAPTFYPGDPSIESGYWRCTQKPEGSSSDYELYHEPHKRCYLQMNTIRYNGNTYGSGAARGIELRQTTQLSQVTRSSRRTAPAHALSADMLQRHGHIDFRR